MDTRFMVVTIDAFVPSNNRLGSCPDDASESLAGSVESWRI